MKPKSERTRVVSARDIKTALKEAFEAGWNSRGKFHEELGSFDASIKRTEFETWLAEVPTDEH